MLAVPGGMLVHELIDESTGGLDAVRSTVDLNTWRHAAESNRFLKPLLAKIGRLDVDLKDLGPEIANRLSSRLMPAFTKSLWAFSQVATFFCFFFFVKEQKSIIQSIRSRLPLIKSESDYLFVRITDAIYAAVYGRVLIGTVQWIELRGERIQPSGLESKSNEAGYTSRGVAQPGSASALGAEGREFESRRPDQFRFPLIPASATIHNNDSQSPPPFPFGKTTNPDTARETAASPKPREPASAKLFRGTIASHTPA